MAKYDRQVEEWFEPGHKGFRLMCCSCALVHEIDFRVNSRGKVEMRMLRHEKATAAARRTRKKKMLIVEE